MKSQKMYIIVFGFFVVKLQISASEPHFPPHIDLQKVGEAIFNNEKFNILKSTTHRVTDHFKDFMLRTESSYYPAKRVFIDNNGFRHYWSGFGEETKSLRKTDLKHLSGSFENASENTSETDIIATNGNDNISATVEDTNISNNNVSSNENENNNQEVENNASDNNKTDQNLTEENTESPESKEKTTTNLFPAIQKNNTLPKITIDKRLRQGKVDNKAKPAPPKKSDTVNKAAPKKPETKKPKTKKPETKTPETKKPETKKPETKKPETKKPETKTPETKKPETKTPETKKPGDDKKDAPANKEDSKNKDKGTDSGDKAKTNDKPKYVNAEKAERTVAQTTFFCPYFGTITMSAFID